MLFGVPRSATAADLTESEAWSASDQQWDDPDPDDRFDLDLEELGGVDSRSLADPAPVDDADAYADHSVLDSLVAEPATAAERREQVRDDIVIEPEPIELAVRLAPELPRICRTCRDFRPAEVGDRGWCANPWAFTHRRMVDPNEPAPCEGTLGSWWLPVDEVWLTGADVSSHGQPTPLLDAMLPHHRDQVIRRRRS